MNRRSGALAPLLALILFGVGANGAGAQPLSLYRDEAVARLHCSGDAVVWLDFKTGRYYLKSQRRYASGYTGSFVCRNEARDSGYRRSPLGLR